MATITAQKISEDGLAFAAGELVDLENKFSNSGKEFIYFKNGSGGSQTITITAETTSVESPVFGDLTKGNASLSVADASIGLIGPFAVAAFNDGDGNVTFTVEDISDSEIGLLYIE